VLCYFTHVTPPAHILEYFGEPKGGYQGGRQLEVEGEIYFDGIEGSCINLVTEYSEYSVLVVDLLDTTRQV
jgi:hypothetical protein